MADFFAELEDDIREERLFLLWRRYGNFIIGLALSIVLATAGYSFWSYLQTQKHLRQSAAFSKTVELITEGHPEKALAALKTLVEEGGGYGKLAQLYQAALSPEKKDLYAHLIKENVRDGSLGNLAKVLQAINSLGDPKDLAALDSLTSPQNAWGPLSRELLALANLKKGETAQAVKHFLAMTEDPLATTSERLRAKMILATLDMRKAL